MRKILVCVLAATGASSAIAANNLFQEFDNQFSIGYGINQTNLSNGAGPNARGINQYLNLEVERLFDNGIWGDIDATMVVNAQQNGGNYGVSNTTTQVPNLGGVNAKVGYALTMAAQSLQVIPYITVGRNTNLANSVIVSNNLSNITNDYFITAGLGGRIEYRVQQWLELYADQAIVYNWDQSNPVSSIAAQNNMLYTTTLGAKFNIYKNLQLGTNAFYTNQQNLATAPSGPNGKAYSVTDGFGGLVTIGLTY